MRHRLSHLLRRNPIQQPQIPNPRRTKQFQSLTSLIPRIPARPDILIKRLNHMVVLSQRMPQPSTKHQLTIRQMTKNLPHAPLTHGNGPLQLLVRKSRNQRAQLRRRPRNHRQRLPPTNKLRIRINRHPSNLPDQPLLRLLGPTTPLDEPKSALASRFPTLQGRVHNRS